MKGVVDARCRGSAAGATTRDWLKNADRLRTEGLGPYRAEEGLGVRGGQEPRAGAAAAKGAEPSLASRSTRTSSRAGAADGSAATGKSGSSRASAIASAIRQRLAKHEHQDFTSIEPEPGKVPKPPSDAPASQASHASRASRASRASQASQASRARSQPAGELRVAELRAAAATRAATPRPTTAAEPAASDKVRSGRPPTPRAPKSPKPGQCIPPARMWAAHNKAVQQQRRRASPQPGKDRPQTPASPGPAVPTGRASPRPAPFATEPKPDARSTSDARSAELPTSIPRSPAPRQKAAAFLNQPAEDADAEQTWLFGKWRKGPPSSVFVSQDVSAPEDFRRAPTSHETPYHVWGKRPTLGNVPKPPEYRQILAKMVDRKNNERAERREKEKTEFAKALVAMDAAEEVRRELARRKRELHEEAMRWGAEQLEKKRVAVDTQLNDFVTGTVLPGKVEPLVTDEERRQQTADRARQYQRSLDNQIEQREQWYKQEQGYLLPWMRDEGRAPHAARGGCMTVGSEQHRVNKKV